MIEIHSLLSEHLLHPVGMSYGGVCALCGSIHLTAVRRGNLISHKTLIE